MISINNKEECSGCTACYSICPKNAISMKEDEEGFLYPNVDMDKCIDCHLCEKVCRIKNPIEEKEKEQRAFLVQNKNKEILSKSTSGGFFTSLANFIINNRGYVCGVVYDNDLNVVHYITNDITEIARFRGSKYVQSYLIDIFKHIKKLLDNNELVLFSGTPCQVEGLLAFLIKKYDNLITIDNVCHSVPSPLVWRKYLEMQRRKYGDIDYALFRDKKPYGYKYSQMALYRKGKCIYNKGVESDYMLRSFFSDIAIRPACANCKFKKRYRLSDFTMWDCFEPNDFYKKLDNDKGVTRVLIQSEKGKQIFEKIKNDFVTFETTGDKLTFKVKEMFKSVKLNSKRERFFQELNSNEISIEKAFKNTFPRSLKSRMSSLGRKTLIRLHIYTPVKRALKKILK